MYDEMITHSNNVGGKNVCLTPKSKIKIFGERHTGTNFLAELCSLNFETPVISSRATSYVKAFLRLQPVMPYKAHWKILQALRAATFSVRRHSVYGWKHGKVLTDPANPNFYSDDLAILCVVKHPIAWVMSLKRRPYESYLEPEIIERMSLEEFVRSPWQPVPFENHRGIFPNVMALWNVKVASYFALAEQRPALILRYEDLLDNAEAAVTQIETFYNLPRKPEFANASSGAKRKWASQEGQQQKNFDHYRDYYLFERWRAKLPANYREIFDGLIDETLLAKLRYTI